jgi:hypothetical protein
LGRNVPATLLAATGLAAVLLAGPADGAPGGPNRTADLPPAARTAVRAGIDFLVANQGPDGSWLSDGQTGQYPVAMTALAGLALLAEGNTPYSGPHADAVRRAVEYLIQRADPETGLVGSEDAGRPMFGHGFSMAFLAEVYGSGARASLQQRIRTVLLRAIALTARSQSPRGGWYYTADSEQDEGAVTITQAQGLRACANAGLPVPAETMERALAYLHASVNPDGGIAYRAGEPGSSRPAITCAAVATMYAAGLYTGDMVEGALAYALETVPGTAPSRSGGSHFFYAHLYLSQVMYFRGGEEWTEYFRPVRDWLVQAQDEDGSWSGEFIGRTYGTSVALLILQLPANSLPLLQR